MILEMFLQFWVVSLKSCCLWGVTLCKVIYQKKLWHEETWRLPRCHKLLHKMSWLKTLVQSLCKKIYLAQWVQYDPAKGSHFLIKVSSSISAKIYKLHGCHLMLETYDLITFNIFYQSPFPLMEAQDVGLKVMYLRWFALVRLGCGAKFDIVCKKYWSRDSVIWSMLLHLVPGVRELSLAGTQICDSVDLII